MEKYSEIIMGNVRLNLGLEADDSSRDDEIMQMDKDEVLECVFAWEGIIGYSEMMIHAIEDIYGITLE